MCEEVLTQSDLESGDVLLVRGKSRFSRWIQRLDGTEVSHAALVISDGMIAEATGDGVATKTLADELHAPQLEYAVVARADPAAHAIAAVLQRADGFLAEHRRYAFERLLLLAVLLLTRRIPFNARGKVVARRLLEAASQNLVSIVEPDSPCPMICSEFVHRCYGGNLEIEGLRLAEGLFEQFEDGDRHLPMDSLWELARQQAATDGLMEPSPDDSDASADLQALTPEQLMEIDPAELVEEDPDASAGGLSGDLLTAIGEFASALGETAKRFPEHFAVPEVPESLIDMQLAERLAACTPLVTSFVTPGDLLRSPSLSRIGRMLP